MKKVLPFSTSSLVSVGVELELQIIDNQSYGLISRSKELIRNLNEGICQNRVKPEITQSMIELNSSVHENINTVLTELYELQSFLVEQTSKFDISFCGGGTHLFQKWSSQKVFPAKRYKKLAHRFGYLTKRATVFGQHVHLGCLNGEDAVYLTHALARYIPQLIAISSASPFYQGKDSGFSSARVNIFNSFPMSGVIPMLKNWQEFSDYYYKMKEWGIIENMKDIYWDVRPKPEFGTVEVRIFDTPLTIKKSVMLAAYLQALALYLIKEKPFKLTDDLYYLYPHIRFEASRYGYDGEFINPENSNKTTVFDDLLTTIANIEPYFKELGSMEYFNLLKEDALNKRNDSVIIREYYAQTGSLQEVVSELCKLWLSH
ncbi:YbdK family carboxylate-amine ligase [Legionella sp. 27cVA30]|uniref:Putative glutamate--cysteine ligase 2 n=1 Tax=Legionella septentrionalis TaxID=2498109 RepID=A0A433JGX0_9GAMM|nr:MULTISPECIES: YbdK family carboxylate-amine ligase [Legionella]MCP0914025.1 YbdK family carboxylate-amine ligase [Legionella sp. 27cVA30]RUQ81500.1 glutamate--cysteine ligase [Legionella septentrionalis]